MVKNNQNTYIRFDWAIKRLLRDKANFGVLEGLLTVLFNDKTKIVEILESEDNHLLWDDARWNRIDLKIKDNKDEFAFVRIQNMRELYYRERLLYGIPDETPWYREVKKVYSISILYFDLGRGNDYLYHGQNRFIGVHTNDELLINAKEENAIVQKLPSEVFPEYYLIRVNEFIIDPETTAPGLPEAREKLRYYDMTPEERYAYDEHINAIMIQNDVLNTAKLEGRAEGIAEGKRNNQLEIARKMKEMGMTADVIAQVTGLAPGEIETA